MDDGIISKISADPYARFLGVTFDKISPGFASCSLVIQEHFFNFMGVVHGGLVFSLADVAFSAASNCDHTPSFALDVSGSFLKSAKLGDVVRAEAEAVHTTKRTGVYRMHVYKNTELIAVFNGTVYRSNAGVKSAVTIETSPLWTEPSTAIEFVYVPGGHYQMGDGTGDGLDDERPVHDVRIDCFYIARTPVTRRQWKVLTGDDDQSALSEDCPVTHVTYDEIMRFLGALSDRNKRSFRLPTEAEWEFAARSGGKNETYSGSEKPDDIAWYGENSGGILKPSARKKPNGLGLYDMSGNVWEWCMDVYRENAYSDHAPDNPVVSGNKDEDRVARGGSYMLDAWSLRCCRRFSFPTDVSGPALGFRPVMIV